MTGPQPLATFRSLLDRDARPIAAGFRERAERTGQHWTASADDHGHVTYVRPPDGTPVRTVERILAGA